MKQLYTTLSTLSRLLMLGVVMLLPVSCIEDCMDKSATGEGMVPINLTISPKAVSTRTATTDIQSAQLASGQTFYAYFTSANVVPQSTTFTANGSGATTPATQPYFKLSETSTDVRAYYPSSVTEGTTSFTVQADQTSDDNYRASDLMFASATISKAFPTSTGALTFAHKMAKIKVCTTTRASSIKAITLKNVLPTVSFTASTGAIGTAEGSATDVSMYSHSGQTSNVECVALIPPQSFASGATLIEITTSVHSSSKLTYQLPAAITFASGLQYIFNVDLHEETITVSYTVTAWNEGETNATEVSIKRDKWMNPLYYVAENNVKSYNSSTKVVTLETSPTAAGSSYCYKWTDAMANFGRNHTATGYDEYWLGDITDGTSSFKYHLPCQKELLSVLPTTANVYDSSFQPSGGTSQQTCIFGYNVDTKAGVQDNTYWGPFSTNLRYALRFLGTPYCSVWKYQFDTSTHVLTITAKLIDVISASESASTLSTILNSYINQNDTWWNHNDESLGNVQRKFYAVGMVYNSDNGGTGTADAYQNYNGHYCSTTSVSDENVRFLLFYTGCLGVGHYDKKYGFSVRLFRNVETSRTRPKLPIEYVALHNMYNSTNMAVNDYASSCGHFNWATACSYFDKHVTINDYNGNALSGKYHLPTIQEWMTILPPRFNTSKAANAAVDVDGADDARIIFDNEVTVRTGMGETLQWGKKLDNTWIMPSTKFYNEYATSASYNSTANGITKKIGYAIRLKERDVAGPSGYGYYTCAYRYTFTDKDPACNNSYSLRVKVRYLGAYSTTTLSDITNDAYWSETEAEYIEVILPTCGFPHNATTYAAPSSVVIDYPERAYYWSNTQPAYGDANCAFQAFFSNYGPNGDHWNNKAMGTSIRLFKDAE